jgi:molybdopterin-binding protein
LVDDDASAVPSVTQFRISEAAALLGVSDDTVRRWADQGRLSLGRAANGVMAQVELRAGPFRIVSLMSREAADELGLEPGVLAAASAKATVVSIELPPGAEG